MMQRVENKILKNNGALISVVMSVYNEPLEYVEKSINSILNQTYHEIEFIVVIDNPQRMELVNMIKLFTKKDNRIKVLINKDNIGLTASLNRALDVASGDFIARMDADDISLSDRLEMQINYMNEHCLDIVGSNVMKIDESGKIFGYSNYPINDSAIKKYLKIEGAAIPHPSWLVKKEVFDRNRYIDFAFCEDYGFLVNSALRGYRMGNIKDYKLKYRNNPNGISSTKKVQQKTGMYYLRRNYRRGVISDHEGYLHFMSSRVGKKKAKALERYYNKKIIIQENIRNKCYFMVFFQVGLLLFFSGEAREIFVNRFKKKYIMRKEDN